MRRILLTGATGYIGGRLRVELERRGVALRCFARDPETLRPRVAASTEVVGGDVLDAGAVARALAGIDAAYYLVHSMASGEDFAARDREAARIFGAAAAAAGVRRIVYLGGLGETAAPLSEHLRSRQETGDLLRASGVPVVEFRASVVLGSGSLSFEMIRALVERLPVMICPRWVAVETQPIAVEDAIAYLAVALDLPEGAERIYEIGGPDRVTYGDLMREYARQRGLRRWLIPVPVLTPRLSSLWLGLVTPLYARVGRKLVDSLRNPTVVRDPAALQAFSIRPRSTAEAIARALVHEDREFAETRWSDAISASGLRERYGGERRGTRLVDSRAMDVAASAGGGVRGREPDRRRDRLVLRQLALEAARVPRPALRRNRAAPRPARSGAAGAGGSAGFLARRASRARPTAAPAGRDEGAGTGLAAVRDDARGPGLPDPPDGDLRRRRTRGLAYWYALYPFHRFVFAGMLRAIAARAGGDTITP